MCESSHQLTLLVCLCFISSEKWAQREKHPNNTPPPYIRCNVIDGLIKDCNNSPSSRAWSHCRHEVHTRTRSFVPQPEYRRMTCRSCCASTTGRRRCVEAWAPGQSRSRGRGWRGSWGCRWTRTRTPMCHTHPSGLPTRWLPCPGRGLRPTRSDRPSGCTGRGCREPFCSAAPSRTPPRPVATSTGCLSR